MIAAPFYFWWPMATNADTAADEVFAGEADTSAAVGGAEGPRELQMPLVIARRPSRRLFGKQGVQLRPARRRIEKVGVANVLGHRNLTLRHAVRYARDCTNTLIDARWRWTLGLFALTYISSWLLFGILWMFVANGYGQLEAVPEDGERCFVDTRTFVAFFLLSMETQTTIGYGGRSIDEHCPAAIFLMGVQMLLAIGLQGAMLGTVFTKMIRPRTNAFTKFFSRYAVICQRDGRLCLMFRVWDQKDAHSVATSMHAYLVQERRTAEGEPLPNYFQTLTLEPAGFLLWPLTVVHIIDEHSPLWDISAVDLLTNRSELIVTLTGASRTTGQLSQIRTSYLSSEIRWGHRIVECVTFDAAADVYLVDRTKFHKTAPVNTPLCSARRLRQVLRELSQSGHQLDTPA